MEQQLGIIVVAPTFYASLDETRYLLGIEACRQAASHKIPLVLVDASPPDEVRSGLEEAGRTKDKNYVKVVRQTASGKKGAALREAIALAYNDEQLSSTEFGVIAFQELEKVDMFRHWHLLVQHMMKASSDVCVPRRRDASFKGDYPLEQYHCESFANMYLDSLGSQIGLASIDWTMGPVAFRKSEAHHWLDFDGELWDAQLVPLVQAHLAGGKVTSFEVDYHHPAEMKEQEQGGHKWIEKRLMQLNFLKDTVGKAMSENIPDSKS